MTKRRLQPIPFDSLIGAPLNSAIHRMIGALGRFHNTVLEDHENIDVLSVTITLTPHHGTEGLRRIVENYEKYLKEYGIG